MQVENDEVILTKEEYDKLVKKADKTDKILEARSNYRIGTLMTVSILSIISGFFIEGNVPKKYFYAILILFVILLFVITVIALYPKKK